MPSGDVFYQLTVGPIPNAPDRIGSDVVGLPAFDDRAGKFAAGAQPLEQVSRGVTVAAMTERLGEIRTAVPFRALTGIRLEPPIRVEYEVPEPHQVALIEWKRQIVLRREVSHRFKSEQILLDRQNVFPGQQRIGGIGKRWV